MLAHVYKYVDMFGYIYICIYKCMYTWMIYIRTHAYTPVYEHIYIYIYICIYTYVQIHTHAYMHINRPRGVGLRELTRECVLRQLGEMLIADALSHSSAGELLRVIEWLLRVTLFASDLIYKPSYIDTNQSLVGVCARWSECAMSLAKCLLRLGCMSTPLG